jgi:hypothetical protein
LSIPFSMFVAISNVTSRIRIRHASPRRHSSLDSLPDQKIAKAFFTHAKRQQGGTKLIQHFLMKCSLG